MSQKAFVYNSWVGGQATDKKAGQANSFANSQSMDFRKSPSQISVLPGTRRDDDNIVIDLVQNEVMTASGKTYSIGSGGNVYTCTSGTWERIGNIGTAGTYGMSYRQDQDAIYIPGTTSVSVITGISTTPTLLPAFYGESQSTYDNSTQAGFNVNSDQSNSDKFTTISTTYLEGQETQERFFQTDIQPISKIGVFIASKGTGNWTLVVHDGLNMQLGTATISNASLVSGVNYFTFSTPIQVNVGPNAAQTYHFHLTSTIADGSVTSSQTDNLSSCDMELWANRLVATTNGIHPQVTFQQFECIGNGRYLSVWENLGEASPSNTAWQRQKLSFPPGFEVCGLTVFNEYLAIAAQRVTSGNDTPQEGIIFYWDGLSDTYNYFTRIPEGSPEAIHEFENAIYYTAGGSWYVITSVAATPEKIRRFPGSENVYTSSGTLTRVYPNMGTVRYGVHLLGWPSTTANPDIPYGVYSWGKTDYLQPNSFGYSYILSTGTQYKTASNNLTIGMVKNFGDILHISWRDDSSGVATYGVDVVDNTSTPASYATWESLIEDNKIVTKQKLASYVEAKWLDIQDGVEIVLKYAINRGDWQYSERFSNDNLYAVDNEPNYARFDVGDSTTEERFYELQVGVDVYCDTTVTSPPTIVGVSAPFDGLEEEKLI
jgi:hypothetical protein